jgi:hypothetical protein
MEDNGKVKEYLIKPKLLGGDAQAVVSGADMA